jgi:prepilin-type N-terminal cleavage/methylation domain-containing protein
MAHRANSRRRQDGFTLVEVIVAIGVASLVIAAAWQMFSVIMGKKGGPSGAVSLTAESFLRQEGIDAIGVLTRRLQEGIQVIEPKAGKSGPTLEFRDILNDHIKLEVKTGGLVAIGPKGEEKNPEPLTGTGKPFYPTKPIRVPGCKEAQFTAISPTCLVMRLTFQDEGGNRATIVNTVQLQNRDLAR